MADHVPSELQARLVACVSPELELSFRPMFGGIMGYAAGRPFASLSNVGLALKLAGADHAALLALPGATPLRYTPDSPPSRSYIVVPTSMLADPINLGAWAKRSATTQPSKRAKPK